MSEFGLIKHIARRFADVDHKGWEAIGDDCTVLPIGGGEALVISTDMLVEGVHFLREKSSAADVGYKSLAVNLSDVAAMGVAAEAVLLSVALPTDATEEWAKEFIDGFHSLAKRQGVALVGGDTTSSDGGIVINVVAIGRGPLCNIKRRSAAQVGDYIYVGGELGGSALGLKDILAGRDDSPYALQHRRAEAQLDEGEWLGGRQEVRAMMDLSDGLASDLGHILKASNCAAEVFTEQIPACEGDIENAVCGGEDYKLLFTVDCFMAEQLERDFESQFGYKPYRIGRIVEPQRVKPQGNSASDFDSQSNSIRWVERGRVINPSWMGFVHF